MKLYDTFKDVFVGELTLDEQQELAKFASNLMIAKRKCDGTVASGLLKEAAEEIHDMWDFNRTAHLLLHLTKTAADSNWGKGADYALKGGMLLAVTAPLIMAATNAIRKNMNFDRSFNEIIRERPMLAGDSLPMTRRHFDALKTFAPDVAQNSLVAGNALHTMHRLGAEYLSPIMVKELANTQKFISDARKSDVPGGVLTHIGNTFKTIGETLKPVEVENPDIKIHEAIDLENKITKARREAHELANPKVPDPFDAAREQHSREKAARDIVQDWERWEKADANKAKASLPPDPAYLGVKAHK